MKLRQRWISLILSVSLMWLTTLMIALQYGKLTRQASNVFTVPMRLKSSNFFSNFTNLSSVDSADVNAGKTPRTKVVKRDGLPKESTIYLVPREHPKYEQKPVLSRNKFEALFRDHPSSNKVPEVLAESDKLQIDFDTGKYWKDPLQRFHRLINRYELYPFNDTVVIDSLMKYLGEDPLRKSREKHGGTQVKLFLTFQNGGSAIMKPWRVPRDYETLPDHYYFADIERHTAEIAAFHLDRILDFRRVPPVTGRIFNLTSQIWLSSDRDLEKRFFYSPAKNFCFMTDCDQYCAIAREPVCGNPDMIEGSVGAFLPTQFRAMKKHWVHPFKRSYSKHDKADWEDDPEYCKREVMKQTIYKKGRRLLDIIDLAIFDFLIGNMDRHSYHTFHFFGNFTSLIHLDQGRAFGRYQTDELSCLVPLMQCCIVRKSTYERLLILQKEEYKLGDVMRESLSTDLIAPVLYEPHYAALDRRLNIVLQEIKRCTAKADAPEEVLKPEPLYSDFYQDFIPDPTKENSNSESD